MKREKVKDDILRDFFISCTKVQKSKKSDIEKLHDYEYLVKTFQDIICVIHDLDRMENEAEKAMLKEKKR